MKQPLRAVDAPLRAVAERLLARMSAADFAGWDPFDGLNSRLFRALPLSRSRALRLAWLQFHKRSPVNFRPLVAVPRVRNAKGLGVTILGLLEVPAADGSRADWLRVARELGDWLLANTCDPARWGSAAWGYPFDWQARAFFVPTGTPNVITSVYVARALAALGAATGEERYSRAAADAARTLDRTFWAEDADGPYYRYIPGDPTFVHNASLWAAAVVAGEAARSGDATLRDHALAVARRSARMQEPDGSWRYGARSHHDFKDSFHTGYNLEALHTIAGVLATNEFDAAIALGLEHFRRDFVLRSGDVRYFHDRPFPLDTHCFSQAVVTLVKIGGTPADIDLAQVVARRMVERLYSTRSGWFAYQAGRYGTNCVPYMRWTQAWAFYALMVAAAARA